MEYPRIFPKLIAQFFPPKHEFIYTNSLFHSNELPSIAINFYLLIDHRKQTRQINFDFIISMFTQIRFLLACFTINGRSIFFAQRMVRNTVRY